MPARPAAPLVLFLTASTLVACGGATADATPTLAVPSASPSTSATLATEPPPNAPDGVLPEKRGDRAAAEAVLRQFLAPGADRAMLTRALRPGPLDYEAVFGADAKRAQAHYDKLWTTESPVIEPKPGQTELLVFGSTTDEVVRAPGEFPGGYAKAKLAPGLPIYRWKFVEPGKTSGMAFDGLVWVNGHFAVFFKPWRATE